MNISFNDFQAYRKTMRPILEQRKLLKGNEPEIDPSPVNSDRYFSWGMLGMSLVIAGLMAVTSCIHPPAVHAEMIEDHDIQVWANAIYKAENSHLHPYGIMAHYHHTTPRQACINTVRHQYRIWCENSCHRSFVAFLASKYAPLLAKNDPNGLNYNWARNVDSFLRKDS